MKRTILLIVMTFGSLAIHAQNNHVRPFEFEVGVGVNRGGTIDRGRAEIGAHFFIEPRYNIVGTPLDVGCQTMMSSFHRGADRHGLEHDISTHLFCILVDINLRQLRGLAPFVGIGAGAATIDHDTSWADGGRADEFDVRSFVINPRLGVELLNHLRITLEYKWMKRGYSFLGLNLGFAFGGGYKDRPTQRVHKYNGGVSIIHDDPR